MPSAVFSVAIASSFMRKRKVFSSRLSFWIGVALATAASSLRTTGSFDAASFARRSGRVGEEVGACQFENLGHVAEAGAHDFGVIAEVFVVVEDVGHRFYAGVFAPVYSHLLVALYQS